MEIFLKNALTKVKLVSDNKRYWFIRTYGGEAYDDYVTKNYVGLGLNNVPYEYIQNAQPNNLVAFKTLQSFIVNNNKHKQGEATKLAKQLISFNHQIAKGDTIIIPNTNSSLLSFGTVSSDVYLEKNPSSIKVKGNIQLLPEKRRRIEWEKTISRDDSQNELNQLYPHIMG